MRTSRVWRAGVLASVVLAGLGSAGCESMSHTERGTLAGGALGTAAGLGVGAALGSPKTGALVGGLAGGGLGAIAGGHKDDRERRESEVIHANAVAAAEAQAQQQRMGISDVMHMAREGHDDQVIINQIRSTGSTFQLAPGDLDMLKNNGVSPRVISEMQSARPVPAGPRVYVREPRPSTVIVHEPYYPGPVYVRPYCYPPRPVVFVGGPFHHRHH